MYATNASHLLAGREMAKEMPGLKKKILAVIDDRTHAGCLALHGTVLPWNADFYDADHGRYFKFPPAHPHCRCHVVPWHEDWEATRYLEGVPKSVRSDILSAETGDVALEAYHGWAG